MSAAPLGSSAFKSPRVQSWKSSYHVTPARSVPSAGPGPIVIAPAAAARGSKRAASIRLAAQGSKQARTRAENEGEADRMNAPKGGDAKCTHP